MITTDQLMPPAQRAVRRLLDACTRHDGVSPLDEAARLALEADAGARHLLVLADEADPAAAAATDGPDPAVLGYASILADGTVQGMVDPAHRRRGIGARLLDGVTELTRAAPADAPEPAVWAHGELEGALALLEGAGWAPRRTLLTLGRPLPGVAVPDTAATLRPLEVTTFDAGRDAEDWVALNARAFADHPEQGRMTLEDLQARMAQPWFDAEGFLLARHLDELVGFVWTKHEPGEADGEIYVVGTSPAAQGHGVARHLLALALRHLASRGARRAVLYVEGDNAPALSLYRRLGFTTIGRDVQLRREKAS